MVSFSVTKVKRLLSPVRAAMWPRRAPSTRDRQPLPERRAEPSSGSFDSRFVFVVGCARQSRQSVGAVCSALTVCGDTTTVPGGMPPWLRAESAPTRTATPARVVAAHTCKANANTRAQKSTWRWIPRRHGIPRSMVSQDGTVSHDGMISHPAWYPPRKRKGRPASAPFHEVYSRAGEDVVSHECFEHAAPKTNHNNQKQTKTNNGRTRAQRSRAKREGR